MKLDENVKPIVITDKEKGVEYTLEFNRKTVDYAERKGFNINDVPSQIMALVPELFFYAFRMHHPYMKKEDTDDLLLNKMGGLTTEALERLMALYMNPYNELVNDEGYDENPQVTVTL